MSVAYDYGYGPYTVEDLHALPDEGKSFELVDGWLIELSPSTRHDFLADRLRRILERAAEDAGVGMYVQAPMNVSTPAGARKPDVAVLDAIAATTARELGLSLYPGADVLLAVEVVSRGSGSEREDRGRKVAEYAKTGIAQYWIVDFDPHPKIQILRLDSDGRYGTPTVLVEGDTLKVTETIPGTLRTVRAGRFRLTLTMNINESRSSTTRWGNNGEKLAHHCDPIMISGGSRCRSCPWRSPCWR